MKKGVVWKCAILHVWFVTEFSFIFIKITDHGIKARAHAGAEIHSQTRCMAGARRHKPMQPVQKCVISSQAWVLAILLNWQLIIHKLYSQYQGMLTHWG